MCVVFFLFRRTPTTTLTATLSPYTTCCPSPGVIIAVAHFAPAAAQASDEVQVPYWASISVDRARMRKGPSIDVPVLWEYRRKDLPVRVIARHDLWRKVEDPDGARGWLAARLHSRARTALVTGEIGNTSCRERVCQYV